MGAKTADSGKGKKSTPRKVVGTALSVRAGELMTTTLFTVKKASSKGVKLAKPEPEQANPYLLPPAEAVRVAKKAGIITRAGNLSAKFK